MFFKYPTLTLGIIIFMLIAFFIFSVITGALMLLKKISYKKGSRMIAVFGSIVCIVNPSLMPLGFPFKLCLIVASVAILNYFLYCYKDFMEGIEKKHNN